MISDNDDGSFEDDVFTEKNVTSDGQMVEFDNFGGGSETGKVLGDLFEVVA